MPAMVAQEPDDALLALQVAHVHVQVHTINAFDLQRDMIAEDIGDAAWYTHDWLRSTPIPLGSLPPLSGPIIEAAQADLADRPEPFYCSQPNTPRRSEAEPR